MFLNITDHSEKLDLLEKTLAIEERQNKRAHEQNAILDAKQEQERIKNMMDGNSSTMESVLEQEEKQRKQLVHDMNVNLTETTKPIVKVLTNLQGKITY